ncbi:trypsin-like serine protease [Neoconidiobolus thromboides FSU 785]|nr:trypsin-like serine protease [Neoconidiobolus thromboides FSU 785]
MQFKTILTLISFTLVSEVISIPTNNNNSITSNSSGKKRNFRIVGGEEVKDSKQYSSFLVSLTENGSHSCAGTLIHGNMVLTAAHCAPEQNQIMEWKAVLNRYNQKVLPESEGATIYDIMEVHVHPKFDRKKAKNDISLWKINRPFEQKVGVLYDIKDVLNKQDNVQLKVIGWGLTSEEGEPADKLMQVNLPLVNNQQCNEIFNNNKIKIDKNSQFCAGDLKGKDACEGDSGGPILLDNFNVPVITGIVSYGIKCGSTIYPGVYTKVNHFLSYIAEVVKKSNPEFVY